MMTEILNEKASPSLEQFVGEFYDDRMAELPKLKDDLLNKDFEAIRRLAHRWKGFCAPYGFDRLGILSELLEKSASLKEFEKSEELVGQIVDYLEIKGKSLK